MKLNAVLWQRLQTGKAVGMELCDLEQHGDAGEENCNRG